jgi:hypothetical protein
MEPAKVADAIASAVAKGADMQLVDDGILEPKSVSQRDVRDILAARNLVRGVLTGAGHVARA